MQRLLTDLLKPHATSRPQHTALCWKHERISYGELSRLTNQVAHALRTHRCRHGDRVLVLIPNSANAVIATFGILKAACIAVPVDVKASSDSLAEIVRECRPPVILAARTARPILDEFVAAYLPTDPSLAEISIGTLEAFDIDGEHFATSFSGQDVLRELPGPLACGATRRAPAFLLDGADESKSGQPAPLRPKPWQPAAISHAAILAALTNFRGRDRLNEFDRVAVSSLTSPFGVVEIFAGLIAGAELHVVPEDFSARPRQLLNFVRAHQLTRWLTTERVLNELVRDELILDGDLPALKQVFWTGAALPASALRDLMQRLPLTEFIRFAKSPGAKMCEMRPVVQSLPEEKMSFQEETLLVAPQPDFVAVP